MFGHTLNNRLPGQEPVTGLMIDMPWLSWGMKIRVLKGILHFKIKINNFHAGPVWS